MTTWITAFTDHPLWVTSAGTTPTLPTGWTTWALWQHTDTGTVPGIDGPIPLNQINGTDDDHPSPSSCPARARSSS